MIKCCLQFNNPQKILSIWNDIHEYKTKQELLLPLSMTSLIDSNELHINKCMNVLR